MAFRLGALLPQSLVARVFLLHSAAMMLFVGLGFGGFVWYTARSSMGQAIIEVDALAAVISPAVGESAVIGDYDTIKRQLERAIDHPALDRARFIDMKGALIDVRRQEQPGLGAPAWLMQRVNEELVDANLPINVGGRDYGVLRLSFHTRHVAGEIWHQGLLALALALSALASGVVLVWFPLKRWLGNLGRIQAFGQQLQTQGGALASMADDIAAPLEFRQTFEILNKAAASLQAERAQAAVTLSAIADGIATTNAQGELVLVNPVLADWLGSSPQTLLGRSLRTLLPHLHIEGDDGNETGGLMVLQRPQGEPLIVSVSRSSVRAGDGQIAGWVYALRDVSEEQRLAAQLQEELAARAAAMRSMRELLEQHRSRGNLSHLLQLHDAAPSEIAHLSHLVADLVQQLSSQSAQLEAIFALSPDAFVAFDVDGTVHYASPAFETLTGCEIADILGLDAAGLSRALQSRCVDTQTALAIDQLADRRQSIELSQPRDRVLELALHRGSGSAIRQVLHIRDLSHQVALDRLKSEFVTTAAHELRTPMTSIYGFSELLMMRTPSPDRLKDILGRIHRQSEAMMHILNELLDLSRMESRRGKDFLYEQLALAPVLAELVQDFQPADGREPPRLEFAPDITGAQVRIDRAKLLQALRNVLSNAYKYSPEGGEVRVTLSRAGREGGRPWLEIAVQDQGIGMTAEELAHVSERFYRADKSGAIPGTGLGMAIVKEIIELMEGHLSLSSEPGVGTCVTLALPERSLIA
ncbi:PAS domain S-box protein [Mitsuaria sp. WAJ17]|uniref:ATP-binding protein n=1 Tax=Mitsuaria sp. WAJ17 TaxID=2761452 RepID=UPI0016049B65|nr:ATP-binding protein [Mitsuaria sp. WAJ17]MBB2483835.1 PAS domain S-box protein [Mitsuaria sp. WAJ17]